MEYNFHTPLFIMKTVLGLDISSSTIGWAILKYDDDSIILDSYGHISPPKSSKGTLTYRVSETYDEMFNFLLDKSPDIVAIEAYANKFSSGRSTARTIIVLSVFNEVVSMASYKALGIEPQKYPVATIRASLRKMGDPSVSSKEDAFTFVGDYFSNFLVRKNRNGNIAKQSYDEADAIAVALTHIFKER